MNSKGFMMAELIVVSSIILVVMVAMFSSFNKVYSLYETRLNYNDITTLYRLGYYRDVIIENNKLEDVINESNESTTDNSNSSIEDLATDIFGSFEVE